MATEEEIAREFQTFAEAKSSKMGARGNDRRKQQQQQRQSKGKYE
jgi:hypothetical protein